MLEYHAPRYFTITFFKKSRDMSIFQAIKLENRQGGIPMVGGRLKPVKSTFFWTGGCADLSIYSLKNQTFHPISLPQPPSQIPPLPSKLSRFYTQLRSSVILQTYHILPMYWLLSNLNTLFTQFHLYSIKLSKTY